MKTIVCILGFLFCSVFNAEIRITTLDDWNINSTSEHDLFVTKQGEVNNDNFVGFQMDRPFCICSNPIFKLNTQEILEEGSTFPALISVDLGKKKDISLKVLLYEAGKAFLKPLNFPSFRKSSVVEVESEVATELFITKGIEHVMSSSKSMCESEYYYEYVEPKAAELDV